MLSALYTTFMVWLIMGELSLIFFMELRPFGESSDD